jgi:hypothetical protein
MIRQQLLILVSLAVVLLINFVRHMLKRRAEARALRTRTSDVSEIPRPARQPPLPVAPGRFQDVSGAVPLSLAVSRLTPRLQRRAPLGGLQAVRRGVVLMTILGPCRALEPPDPHA